MTTSAKILIAGFGGQGVLLIGQMIAYAGMIEEKEVSWLPSYGPEMRGGTANCSIIVSNETINSPMFTVPDILVAMNLPSLKKFEHSVITGGKVFVNSSLIRDGLDRKDIQEIRIDSNHLAEEFGGSKFANMIMLGAIIQRTGIVTIDGLFEAMESMFLGKKERFIPININAIKKGFQISRAQ